jgi:putative ABC transport system permease protein
MLILVLNGFLDGMYRQITSYLDYSPGTLVVAQEDVVNLLGATSLLPVGIASQVEAVRGVDEAIPILSQFVILDLHGKKQPTYMVGYDPDEGGGPWKLHAGRQPRAKREIVFDQVLAERHGLKIGDTVEVLGKGFTIVGLSNGTTSWMTSFSFMQKTAAEDLLLAPGATSYLLVTTVEGADLNEILRRLNKLNGVNALTKREMAANDLKLFAKVFSAPLKLMVAIAFLVGTMIIGLVIYTITVERQREYGVIKATGAANRVLYQVVLTQALVAACMGTIAGVMLAFSISQWIMVVRPQFLIVFDPFDVGWALLAGLVMALVAALFPARLVAGLAPAEVFRK